ncbi:hypothetical protein EW145_g2982 [Phellinidium pouzarii]|uniref:Rab proteins geranylgeranyltransferase n=1 Tax=Phellinidium pouzarii TaxID=167371 RepID=A0A4S4LAR9_9AGAM|nr:hypothetical protein EW145_g2982 [Phellinidium pouzarii]
MDTHFHALVLGTGITESIAAAALSKAGLKVVHVDVNHYYGANEASLTSEELLKWIETISTDTDSLSEASASVFGELSHSPRSYSLSLSPSVIVSTGPLISSLIGSGVSRYGGFNLLGNISVYSAAGFKSVPGSKEEIFKSKELSLMDKRRLMRFLTFAGGDFENSPEIQGRENMHFLRFLVDVFSLERRLASALAYALALCISDTELVIPALTRLKRYLRAAGRYGPSPFLVGQYGGMGELAQGFCRVAAVSGGTYILGHDIFSIDMISNEAKSAVIHRLKLDSLPRDLTADIIISSPDILLKYKKSSTDKFDECSTVGLQACCILVVDGSITSIQKFDSTERTIDEAHTENSLGHSRSIDSALLVFPPGELPSGTAQGPVHVLLNGEGTLSCPRGRSILYFSTALDTNAPYDIKTNPEILIRPYITATLSMICTAEFVSPKELFSGFYLKSQHSFSASFQESLKEYGIVVCSSPPAHFAERGDAAAVNAEGIYREVLKRLGRAGSGSETELWPPLPMEPDDADP